MPAKETLQIHSSYSQLLRKVQNEINTARRKIDHTRALAYWKVGRYISEDLLKNKKRARYGEYLYARLAGDLKMGVRTIQRAVQFHREYPIPSPATQLSWAHYSELLSVSDKVRRNYLEQWAIQEGAPRDLLRKEIAGSRPTTQQTQKTQITLIPKKGALNVYQAVESFLISPPRGEILLDCGFNVWTKVSRREIKASQIVEARAKMSFTYKAYVQEVIDGDTLWAVIDLGLGNYTSQKLRLRGIDCPEINTLTGKKAKKFVEHALGLSNNEQRATNNEIIIRSSKSDKYDRYLADVFYGKEEKFLNQELLDANLAVLWKE